MNYLLREVHNGFFTDVSKLDDSIFDRFMQTQFRKYNYNPTPIHKLIALYNSFQCESVVSIASFEGDLLTGIFCDDQKIMDDLEILNNLKEVDLKHPLYSNTYYFIGLLAKKFHETHTPKHDLLHFKKFTMLEIFYHLLPLNETDQTMVSSNTYLAYLMRLRNMLSEQRCPHISPPLFIRFYKY